MRYDARRLQRRRSALTAGRSCVLDFMLPTSSSHRRNMLKYTIAAERAGFDCAMSSDHFKPWSRSQGHSGYSWSWLGAALARTEFPIGVICAAGYRYHPAVVAQAAATLTEMFPERFWFALGSGERVNEDVTGMPWPSKPERNEKMVECAGIIRSLLKASASRIEARSRSWMQNCIHVLRDHR